FLDETARWLDRFSRELDEYETLLTKNKIWVERTQGVGVLKTADAIELGVSGPTLRACGYEWDLRKTRPYLCYDQLEFDVPIGTTGDVYDRYLVRIEEMRQAVRICRQVVKAMPGGPINVDDPKLVLPSKEQVLTGMEQLIHQFIIVTEGFHAPKGEV